MIDKIVVIPCRLISSRLPKKLLIDIGGKSVKVETRVVAGRQNAENILYFMSWPTAAQ